MVTKNKTKRGKYTEKRVEIIIQGIKNLGSKTEICKYAGITMDTFYEWYNKKPDFKKMVDDAEVETMDKIKTTAIKSVVKAMNDDYRAATWYLERKHPEEYGRKDRVDTNMTIDAVKIKYVLPTENEDNRLNENNDIVNIEIPEKNNE